MDKQGRTRPVKLFNNYSNYSNKGGQSEQSEEMNPLKCIYFKISEEEKSLR